MKPAFSFHYQGVPFHSGNAYGRAAEGGEIFELGNGVEVCLRVKEYKEFDAVEWVLYFENKSNCDSGIFSDIFDADALLPLELPTPPSHGYMPKEGDACVISMSGSVSGRYYWESDKISATEFGLNHKYLDKTSRKTKSFTNSSGRSSEGMMPFFDVTAMGSGYITAIGWTGDWRAEFSRQDGGILMRSGLKETNFYLKPGERIRTSSTLIMKYSADEDKYNKFRRFIKERVSHKSCTKAKREGLMAFELWGGLPSEEMKKRIRDLQRYDIRFEDIWIDAGWYGNCTKCDDTFSGDWSMHTGEWEVNTRVHPGYLRDVAECAGDAGMKLMLWLEPERAIEGTNIIEQHPDWFLSVPGHTSRILNYGNDEALHYVKRLLSYYVKDLGLSCYRQDFNIRPAEYFRANDEENRRGITEIKHIMGMYRLWDDLLAEFPDLIIDNCASGGKRIDIETIRRSIPFFRSDYQCNFNENPEVLQTHNAGISLYLPYNGCTSKTKGDTYAIRSSYSASWGGAFYNAVFQSMTEADFAWAKKITDEYRSIRKYFSKDFYNLGSSVFDDTSWAIWQYHDGEAQSGIVMVFRRSNSPFDRVQIELKGLLRDRTYTVLSLDDGSSRESSGELEIVLKEKRSCTILEYRLK